MRTSSGARKGKIRTSHEALIDILRKLVSVLERYFKGHARQISKVPDVGLLTTERSELLLYCGR